MLEQGAAMQREDTRGGYMEIDTVQDFVDGRAVVERPPVIARPQRLASELSALLGDTTPRDVVMAFDGDGTLWSGDVGEDLFRAALRERISGRRGPTRACSPKPSSIRCPSNGARERQRRRGRADCGATSAGKYPERETCAMMTWCYAGRTLADVQALAEPVLQETKLATRLHGELAPILEWSRQRGRAQRADFRFAARRRGTGGARCGASLLATSPQPRPPSSRIGQARMAAPCRTPKPSDRRTGLFGDARWLAAFGDNVFDIDMLTAAELGVAVRPKPKLATELAALGLRLLARCAPGREHEGGGGLSRAGRAAGIPVMATRFGVVEMRPALQKLT